MSNKPNPTLGQILTGVGSWTIPDKRIYRVQEICAEMIDMVIDHKAFSEQSTAYETIKDHAIHELLSAQLAVMKLLTFKD